MTAHALPIRKFERPAELKKSLEIFLEYVSPIMKGVPKKIAPEKLKEVLVIPIAVWNAVSMSHWGQGKNYLDLMFDQLDQMPEPQRSSTIEILNFWSKRKEELFSENIWAWEVDVFRDQKQALRLKAEVRIPKHLEDSLPQDWNVIKKSL